MASSCCIFGLEEAAGREEVNLWEWSNPVNVNFFLYKIWLLRDLDFFKLEVFEQTANLTLKILSGQTLTTKNRLRTFRVKSMFRWPKNTSSEERIENTTVDNLVL